MRRAHLFSLLALSGCAAINPDYDLPTGTSDGGEDSAAAETGEGESGSAGESTAADAAGDGDGDTGDGTAGDGSSGDGDGFSGDGDGDGDGSSGDGDGSSGDGDGSSGDGDGSSGDGDGSSGDGDGTSGAGDGTSGDGDGTSGDGDGTSGDGDGSSGDGDGDGTSGDGDGATGVCGLQGVIACYELELPVANVLIDSGPNGIDGVFEGLTGVPAVSGNGANLDLMTKAGVPPHPLLDPPNITAAAWINLDALPAPGSITPLLTRVDQFGLAVADDGRIVAGVTGGPLFAGGSVTPGTWTHVAFTYNTQIVIYQDGQALGGVTIPGAPALPPGTGDLLIGNNGQDMFVGVIDQVVFFDRVLNSPEVCAIAGC